MEISKLKKQYREEVKNRIAKLSDGEKAQRSYSACINVLNSAEYKKAKTVMIYKAMKDECDPALIEYAARETGKVVAYPLCMSDSRLKVFAPKTQKNFKKGRYDIWEPVQEESDEIDFEDIDLIIVPGMAFDKQLRRLGRGGGYYDRFLPQCINAVKMGFAFKEQIVDCVPIEDTDIKLDKLVTNI